MYCNSEQLYVSDIGSDGPTTLDIMGVMVHPQLPEHGHSLLHPDNIPYSGFTSPVQQPSCCVYHATVSFIRNCHVGVSIIINSRNV